VDCGEDKRRNRGWHDVFLTVGEEWRKRRKVGGEALRILLKGMKSESWRGSLGSDSHAGNILLAGLKRV